MDISYQSIQLKKIQKKIENRKFCDFLLNSTQLLNESRQVQVLLQIKKMWREFRSDGSKNFLLLKLTKLQTSKVDLQLHYFYTFCLVFSLCIVVILLSIKINYRVLPGVSGKNTLHTHFLCHFFSATLWCFQIGDPTFRLPSTVTNFIYSHVRL